MTNLGIPLLSVDPDAAFDSVAHDQLGGPYQVPSELVRFAIACGANRVEVICRRQRLVVEAPGAFVPASALRSLGKASGPGDGIERLRALAVLEDLGASALGWAVGLNPKALVIRSSRDGVQTTLSSENLPDLRVVENPSQRGIGLIIDLKRPHLNFERARKWLEIACRFSPIPVIVNGEVVQNELDSGCFRARITSPLPAVVALGVELQAPRLWLLRHGVVATRIGIPNWPPFEAAVELQGRVEGRASAAQLRQCISPYLEALIARVTELMVKVVPRLPQLSVDHRRRITCSLLKAVEKGVSIEAIWNAALFEIIDSAGARWVSLADLKHWPDTLPPVEDRLPDGRSSIGPCLVLGPREREMVANLIDRSPASAVTKKSGFWNAFGETLGAAGNYIVGKMGPKPLAEDRLETGERSLIRALEGALTMNERAITVRLTLGRRKPRRWGRRLVLGRDRMATQNAVHEISRNRAAAYVVALAFMDPGWRVTPGTRADWHKSTGLV